MAECPYCSAEVAADERYCPRCSERLDYADPRTGAFQQSSLQYLQGVRHNARRFDPDSPYHEQLRTDVAGALADLAYLADVEVSLLALLDEADFEHVDPDVASAVDPDRFDLDADRGTQELVGLATLARLLDDAFPGSELDELLALGRELENHEE